MKRPAEVIRERQDTRHCGDNAMEWQTRGATYSKYVGLRIPPPFSKHVMWEQLQASVEGEGMTMDGTMLALEEGKVALPDRNGESVATVGGLSGTMDPPPQRDSGGGRLVIVSNRLPVTIARNGDGEHEVRPSSGGLATALRPIVRKTGGWWFGWSGTYDTNGEIHALLHSDDHGCCFKPVPMTEEDVEDYYLGFSNRTLWPLLHGLGEYCEFDRGWWNAYRRVNRRFAWLLAQRCETEDFVWVHDYHLMLVGRELRNLGVEQLLCFFLHTPFPAMDTLARLPWLSEVVQALLDYDLIGFQTLRDKENFVHCVRACGKVVDIEDQGRTSVIDSGRRRVRASVFPIAIDFGEFASEAASSEVSARVNRLQRSMPGRQILLGIDRLDYSKGIPLKLHAFATALERFKELRGGMTLVQVVVPSRESIPEYRRVKKEVEALAANINERFGHPGWTPVQCLYRSLDRAELLAYYRAASAALVTSVRDGMNLVAKEYCAANTDGSGVLILSRYAGSAVQLRRDALLINPYDVGGVAKAIRKAFRMSAEERASRMRSLRKRIRKRDIHWWLDLFLRTAAADTSKLQAISAMNALSLANARAATHPLNLPANVDREGLCVLGSPQTSGQRR